MVNFCIFIMMVEVVLGVLSVGTRVRLFVPIGIDGKKRTDTDGKGYVYHCESGYDHCNCTFAPKRKKDIHMFVNVFSVFYCFSVVFDVYFSCFSSNTTHKRQGKQATDPRVIH